MISKDKEYRTACGYAVSGLRETVEGWVGFADAGDGYLFACEWTDAGKCLGVAGANDVVLSGYHLIEVKPRIKRTVWLNVEDDGVMLAFDTTERAKSYQSSGIIACVPVEIDCEEGEGL